MQFIHARIRVGPAVAKGGLIERAQEWLYRRPLQKQGARWNQQPNGVLHRIDVVDKALQLHHIEYIYIIIEGRPWCERYQRRTECDTGLAHDGQGFEDVGPGVPLL